MLYGDVEPGGRLAETFPLAAVRRRQRPVVPAASRIRSSTARACSSATGTSPRPAIEPLFAFGHGLGYTTFEYGGRALDADAICAPATPLTVTVAVTNTGDRAGSDGGPGVRRRPAPAGRPARGGNWPASPRSGSPPGEPATVAWWSSGRALRLLRRRRRGWRIPSGDYLIEVGPSSEDIAHTCLIEVAGDFTGHHADEPHIAYSVDSFERRLGRAIPPARPVRPYSRVSTIGEIPGNPLGRLVRTAVLRFSGYHDEQDPTTAKMIERSLDEMPLRGIALLGGGKVKSGDRRRPGRPAQPAAGPDGGRRGRRPDRGAAGSVNRQPMRCCHKRASAASSCGSSRAN